MLNISSIPIEVCKKDIKNMHIYVKPPNGYVTVSAPLSMSDMAIERFVRTKTSWIKKQIANFDNQPRQSEREYVSGETLYVWGKQYEYGNKKFVSAFRRQSDFDRPQRKCAAEQRENFVREWYQEQLKAEITRLLPKLENIAGLKASGWQTKYSDHPLGNVQHEHRKDMGKPAAGKKNTRVP